MPADVPGMAVKRTEKQLAVDSKLMLSKADSFKPFRPDPISPLALRHAAVLPHDAGKLPWLHELPEHLRKIYASYNDDVMHRHMQHQALIHTLMWRERSQLLQYGSHHAQHGLPPCLPFKPQPTYPLIPPTLPGLAAAPPAQFGVVQARKRIGKTVDIR